MGLFSQMNAEKQRKKKAAIASAKQALKQLNESSKIVNNTTNPKIFFGRLNLVFDKLLELQQYERFGIFRGASPTQDLQNNVNQLELIVDKFITRALDAEVAKIYALKTEKSKINHWNKFCKTMLNSFVESGTFWRGASLPVSGIILPHYDGMLYSEGNLKRVKELSLLDPRQFTS